MFGAVHESGRTATMIDILFVGQLAWPRIPAHWFGV